ncbi:hypothetical protein MITS9509_03551 [Synechococcus sp. MIT S9509]|uniref:hypothetical protein n=1 Tax=Synechococcus sp. MIT S9509 TaxID=1801630 RepID=UPI0007BB3127|nr:hypothetical protein [Synechococcus sp. MIT S9509]KZR85595.1 hypothetical protein MITS9509_03551 [Synechococcus sp. MIT S9509]
MTKRYGKKIQASRSGKAAICIFVKPEMKSKIISALATRGYGINFQEGITRLLEELIEKTSGIKSAIKNKST